MEPNPRDYGERCRFDAFCKTVLKHEAIDYIREMKRRASQETSLERLPQTAMNKLCSANDYPSDSYVFSYCGYGLPIRSQQVADAFAGLPEAGFDGQRDRRGLGIVPECRPAAQNKIAECPADETDSEERRLAPMKRRYYKGYINKLCTQTVYDESGCPHACLDEYMKSRLENKLIRAILGVN